jgi:hypothetical protein
MQPTQLSRSIRNGIVVNFGKGVVAPAGLTRQEATFTEEEIAEQADAQAQAELDAEQAAAEQAELDADAPDFDGV